MIRFLSDWKKYPTAIVDTNTKNLTFLRLAGLYKKMGIKNYFFLLSLMTPELSGVDPHDPDLTEDLKLKISVECKYNVWYFLREVVRVPPATGNNPVPYRANRGNIAMTWCFLCNIDVALIQPRQTGKSVSTDAVMIWLMYFALNGTTVSLITKDNKLRVANIERLKKFRDLLPEYLVYFDKNDANNQSELTYKKLGNKYITSVAQNSETQANNVARGNTVPITQVDEGPFISFVATTVPAALAAGTAVRQEAELNGTPYGNIFTTTAGKKDDRDGEFMYNMISNAAGWSERYFDAADKEELVKIVTVTARSDNGIKRVMINCTMSHQQLGYTDEWLYAAISQTGGTEESINRDFFNVWSSGSQGSLLSAKLNEIIRLSEREPDFVEIFKEGYGLRWYIPEANIQQRMATGQFVLTLDTSEALGNDDMGLLVTDVRDLSVVAAGTFNETNLINFASWLSNFMVKYTNTTLVIERKSSATSILGYLMLMLPLAGVDPFKRIFNKVVDKQYERKDDFRAVSVDLSRRNQYFYDKYIKDFGFITDGDNRNHLYSQVLQNAAKKSGHLVHDKILSEQIRSLTVRKGRVDHASGGHDDMVIAWLLAHWFLTEAKHLDYYGIDVRNVMALVSDETRTLSPEEVQRKQEQVRIKAEIESVLEQLVTVNDEFSIMRLEHRLRTLAESVKEDTENPLSVAELLFNASEKRKMRCKVQNYQRPNTWQPNPVHHRTNASTRWGAPTPDFVVNHFAA